MIEDLNQLLDKTLNLNGRGLEFIESTKLLGELPELDSLAVRELLSAIEQHYKIHIEDDEIDGSVFETVGSLYKYIQHKVGQK